MDAASRCVYTSFEFAIASLKGLIIADLVVCVSARRPFKHTSTSADCNPPLPKFCRYNDHEGISGIDRSRDEQFMCMGNKRRWGYIPDSLPVKSSQKHLQCLEFQYLFGLCASFL